MRIIGFSEEITQCSLCLKSELKGTWIIEAENEIAHLGSSCVKKRFEINSKQFYSLVNGLKEARRKERDDFLYPYHENLDNIYFKFPEASIYEPEKPGYKEVKEAISLLKDKTLEASELFKINF